MTTWDGSPTAEAREPRATPPPSCARDLPPWDPQAGYYARRDADAPWCAWVLIASFVLAVLCAAVSLAGGWGR